jgi:hypothetical protein
MNIDDKSQDPDSAIPLLEDVVSLEEIESEYIEFNEDEAEIEDSGVPEYDEELLAMRDEIARQLENELQDIVTDVLKQIIEDTTSRIAQILHDELDSTLTQRIRFLIEKRLEGEFGPRHQHAREEIIEDSIEIYRDDNL